MRSLNVDYDNQYKWYERENISRMTFLDNFLFNSKEKYSYTKKRLLDIGCFKSCFCNYCPPFIDYFGLDFKNYSKNGKVKIQNLNKNTKLQYPNKYFDFVIATGILEHLFNPDKIMVEIRRILKHDGIVIISLPNEKNLHLRLRLLIGVEPLSIEEQKNLHHWVFSPKIAREWVSKYFKIIEETPYIGLWGRKFVPKFLVDMYPNLFCSDYFFKCVIK